MKNIIPFLFVLALFSTSCNQTKNDAGTSQSVSISGKIEKPTSNTIIFYYNKGFSTVRDTAGINADGTFKINLPLTQERLSKLKHGHEYSSIYLRPGDSLYLTLTTDSFDESLHYSGKGAEANNFLAASVLQQEIEFNEKNTYLKSSKDSFLMGISAIRDKMEKRLSNFYEKNKDHVSEQFIHMQKQLILYDWALMYTIYPGSYEYYNQKNVGDLGPDFEKYIQELNFNDSTVIGSEEFNSFIQAYFSAYTNLITKIDSSLQKNPTKLTDKKFEKVKELFKGKLAYDYVLTYLLDQQLKYDGVEGIENVMKIYRSECSNEAYKKKVQEKFDQWSNLAKGKPAPTFTYVDINGKQVSLADFKGKYVYIDVWATWCGPCKKEIPFMIQLEEEFKNKNVAFLKISVDDNKQDWENFVKEQKLEGVQLWAGGWNADINKNYIINSIPRFILIDTEGKIIDVNTARPSGKIKDILDKLEGIKSSNIF